MLSESVIFRIFTIYFVITAASSNLKLSIIHINDFHARFEEIAPSSGMCKGSNDTCVGGFSRIYTMVNYLYKTRPNPISLNAGDSFQGTPWYTMFKWNVTQFFLNFLPTDAMTLGNHEFDGGIEGLIPFLKTIRAPIVVSNINDTLEPTIQGLYQKSIVKQVDGKKIGIVGVISSVTKEVSYTGKLSFLDESLSVNTEARRLLDEEGVFTVIVVSHCAYELDKQIAKQAVPGISLVVGGHSHTLLYTGTPPAGKSSGNYPTVVTSIYNETVLVVQADAFSRYVGNLSVEFDNMGKLKKWEGNPIYLDKNIAQDEYINGLLQSYKLEVERFGSASLGKTNVLLEQASCFHSECNLGNLITDSMVASNRNYSSNDPWNKAVISIINAGGIRSPINIGDITLNNLITVLPFGDKIIYGELQGKYIKEIMETVAAPFFHRKIDLDINLMQVSGLKLILDQRLPIGSRVVSLKMLCHECQVEIFEDVDLEKYYPITMTTYLAKGGDNHKVLRDNLINRKDGRSLIDALSDYIKKKSPLTIGLDGRIVVNGRNNNNK